MLNRAGVQFSWPRGVAENWFTKPGFWEKYVDFPRQNSKTQSSLNFLLSGPRKFTKSDFSGLAPIRRVLKKVTDTVTDVLFFWINKSCRYRWARRYPSPSLLELPKSYRFVIFLWINFGKLPIPLPILYYFEIIMEVLANTGYLELGALGPQVHITETGLRGSLPIGFEAWMLLRELQLGP